MVASDTLWDRSMARIKEVSRGHQQWPIHKKNPHDKSYGSGLHEEIQTRKDLLDFSSIILKQYYKFQALWSFLDGQFSVPIFLDLAVAFATVYYCFYLKHFLYFASRTSISLSFSPDSLAVLSFFPANYTLSNGPL